jgi:hypothetical protein
MSRFIYKEFLPINDSASLKEGNYKDLTKNEIKKWRNFKYITKSEHIADELAKEQNNICPACKKIIKKSERVIHHLDYERLCKYLECFKVSKPTPKQPFLKIKTPKCSKCPETNICKKKIVLIHNNCHFKIHIFEGRIKKPKNESEIKRIQKTEEEKLEYWRTSLNKNHKEIIQKSINLIIKLNPENEFYLKYYSKYIGLKPSNSVTFKNSDNNILIKIKRGNLIEIKDLLSNRGIESNLYYKKGELNNINFLIEREQFNKNFDLIEIIFKHLTEYNNN